MLKAGSCFGASKIPSSVHESMEEEASNVAHDQRRNVGEQGTNRAEYS